MAARCIKMTAKQLVARAERDANRKLTSAERNSLNLLPPQFDCSGSGTRRTKRLRRR